MSSNVLVALTDENRVFFAGFYRHFNFRELILPEHEKQKVVKVGASHNGYYITMEDGSVYCNKKIQNFETNEYYGKSKLYRYACQSGAQVVARLSGKYESLIGSAHS
jgi:hypothetical protein